MFKVVLSRRNLPSHFELNNVFYNTRGMEASEFDHLTMIHLLLWTKLLTFLKIHNLTILLNGVCVIKPV